MNVGSPSPNKDGTAKPLSGRSEDRRTRREGVARRSAMLFSGLFIGLVVLAGAFIAFRQSIGWIDHTHQVLSVVEQISSNLTEAESGQRGYLLTREGRYLTPYLEGIDHVQDLLNRAQILTADNPTQQDNIRRLRPLAEAKLDVMALTLRQADTEGLDQALGTVRTGSGERLMSQIRTLIAGMKAEEDDLLLVRAKRARLLEILLTAFALAFGAASFWSVRSTFHRLNHDYEAERAEGEALTQALHRNAMLLDEVNHRVKNSLQVVSNLLRTQALNNTNAIVREQLLESSSRVETIAEVHRRLYGTDTYDTVEITDLLRDIAEIAVPLTNTADHTVNWIMPEPISLPVRDAISVALIVNELLTNTFKHAFPNGRTGTIRLEVEHLADELHIAVDDDGIGLPEGAEAKEKSSFGLGMVRLLAGQLNGTLEVHRKNPGSRFTLRFPCTQQA